MNETTLELLKPIMIDFEKLKVGDEVWDVTRGASKITKLEKGWQYPITVEFYNPDMEFHEYSYKGHSYEDDPYPSLYLQDPFDYLAGMIGKGEEIVPAEVEAQEKLAGHLTKPFGIKGNETAQIGHQVFETKDRYVIYLNPNGLRVAFYKETLDPHINRITDLEKK